MESITAILSDDYGLPTDLSKLLVEFIRETCTDCNKSIFPYPDCRRCRMCEEPLCKECTTPKGKYCNMPACRYCIHGEFRGVCAGCADKDFADAHFGTLITHSLNWARVEGGLSTMSYAS